MEATVLTHMNEIHVKACVFLSKQRQEIEAREIAAQISSKYA